MTIKEQAWKRYITALRKVNDLAADDMEAWLDANRDDPDSWDDIDREVIAYAYGLTTKYGSAAAELACEMYDSVARASKVNVPEAEPAELPSYSRMAAAMNGVMVYSVRSDVVAAEVGRHVKRAAADTVLKNAKRDGAETAWIPAGTETCQFCLMLAANGWRPVPSGEHAEHIHAHCDCMYAVRFNKDTEYEGYSI